MTARASGKVTRRKDKKTPKNKARLSRNRKARRRYRAKHPEGTKKHVRVCIKAAKKVRKCRKKKYPCGDLSRYYRPSKKKGTKKKKHTKLGRLKRRKTSRATNLSALVKLRKLNRKENALLQKGIDLSKVKKAKKAKRKEGKRGKVKVWSTLPQEYIDMDVRNTAEINARTAREAERIREENRQLMMARPARRAYPGDMDYALPPMFPRSYQR
jgi:hypothetical protein